MASGKLADATVSDQRPVDATALNNSNKDDDEILPKKAKIDEGDGSSKKRRNSLGKQKPDDKVMAEAKAVYGDLDLSEGRRLRKRIDPPKVEEKRKSTPRRSTKKPQAEDSAEEAEKPAEKSPDSEDDRSVTAKSKDVEKEAEENDKPVDTKTADVEEEEIQKDEIKESKTDSDTNDETKQPASSV